LSFPRPSDAVPAQLSWVVGLHRGSRHGSD